MKQIIIFLILFLFLPFKGKSCTCSELRIDLPIKEFGLTDNQSTRTNSMDSLVFHGILLSGNEVENETWTKYELKFKILKIYKGIFSLDTISVRTPMGSDACGFGSRINTESLIFCHKSPQGIYYTYSSECCRSVSKYYERNRFQNYINFLEIITSMKDGKYIFKQPKSYYKSSSPDSTLSKYLLKFEIQNNQLHGDWELKDRHGNLLEQGQYKNGKKVGKWIENHLDIEKDFFISINFYKTVLYKEGILKKEKCKSICVDLGTEKNVEEYFINGKLVKRKEIDWNLN